MPTDRPLAGCRILVVEDEYFIAMELQAVLEQHGAQVIGPLGRVEDVLKQLQRDGFGIAVLDINLHGIEVYSCADELVRQQVPFVFASAYRARDIPPRFASVHLWQKPYNPLGLVDDLKHLCEGLRSGQPGTSSDPAPP